MTFSTLICRMLNLWVIFGGVLGAFAADGDPAPVHGSEGSAIRECLVLGPFASKVITPDFLDSVGGEANVRPREGDVVVGKDGVRLTWKRLRSTDDRLAFTQEYGRASWAVYYAYWEWQSDTDRTVYVSGQRSGPEGQLHVAGNPVFNTPGWPESVDELPHVFPVQLRAGRNPCLLKVSSDTGPLEVIVQLQPPGRAVVDLQGLDADGKKLGLAWVEYHSKGRLLGRSRLGSKEEGIEGKARVLLSTGTDPVDIRIQHHDQKERGTWLLNVALRPDERRELLATVGKVSDISGRVLAMDGSPQAGVVVQARLEGAMPLSLPIAGDTNGVFRQYVETSLSDSNGGFRFPNVRPGRYELWCHAASGLVRPSKTPAISDSSLGAGWVQVDSSNSVEGVEFKLPEVKKGNWRHYTLNRGLDTVGADVVCRTSDGSVWSAGGGAVIHRSDGLGFSRDSSIPPLSGQDVRVLREGLFGELWIGTRDGVYLYAQGGLIQDTNRVPRIPGTVHDILPEPDGVVWVGFTGGLGRWKSGALTVFGPKDGLPASEVFSIIRGRDGTLWALTRHSILKFDGKRFEVAVAFAPHANPLVTHLLQTRDGALWVLTEGDGVFRYSDGSLVHLGRSQGFPTSVVEELVQAPDGALWFGTEFGPMRFNGLSLVVYGLGEGFQNPKVRELTIDPSGVVWSASAGGISRYEPDFLTRFTPRDGLSSTVFTVLREPDGGVMAGTEWGGIQRVKGDVVGPVPVDSPWDRYYVRRLQRATDGTVWAATQKGVLRFEGDHFKMVKDSHWSIVLTVDHSSNLWFGHMWQIGGLTRYNPQTGQESLFSVTNGLPADGVNALDTGADGTVWIGTSAGLGRYRGGQMENLADALGAPRRGVLHLRSEPDGTVWVGTMAELHCLEPLGVKSKTVGTPGLLGARLAAEYRRISITTSNGLTDSMVWSSARTSDGVVWIGSDRSGLFGYDGKVMTSLDTRDGLGGNLVLSIEQGEGGVLWLGTSGGLVRYGRSSTRPGIRLGEASVDDTVIASSNTVRRIALNRRLRVNYQEIDDKTHLDKRQFYYELRNGSGQTVMKGVTKERHFTWMPKTTGSYALHVQAVDRDLNYSDPMRFEFRAYAPWFANLWVLVPGGGVFGGLAVWAFVARALYTRKQRESAILRERLLEQQSQARESLEKKSEQLAQAKDAAEAANRAKSAFLANMSHEIRTPLNAILGFSELLRHRVTDPLDRSYLAGIAASGKGLLMIINDILDLSKVEAGRLELRMEPVSLRQVLTEVDQVFSQAVAQKGLEFKLHIEPEVPEAMVMDETRLRQVLINVVGNAVKFTRTGGIRVSASASPGERADQVNLRLEVADTGIGIAAADLGRIFDAFAQVNNGSTRVHEGTGLGLTITKRLVEMMGGKVGVESIAGEGTTFRIDFAGVTLSAEEAVTRKANEGIRLDQLKPARILVAEDKLLNRRMLAGYFDGTGHQLVFAANGRQAVDEARKERPDLILMDLRMPEMDGWEATRLLREDPELSSVPIIILTASIENVKEGFVDGFLRKPVAMAELAGMLSKFLPCSTGASDAQIVEGGTEPCAEVPPTEVGAFVASAELVERLERELKDVWPGLCELPNMAQIERFALDLEQLGAVHQSSFLASYASSLRHAVAQFDMEKVETRLKEFPQVIETVLCRRLSP